MKKRILKSSMLVLGMLGFGFSSQAPAMSVESRTNLTEVREANCQDVYVGCVSAATDMYNSGEMNFDVYVHAVYSYCPALYDYCNSW